jgi:hypothetical protein
MTMTSDADGSKITIAALRKLARQLARGECPAFVIAWQEDDSVIAQCCGPDAYQIGYLAACASAGAMKAIQGIDAAVSAAASSITPPDRAE